MRISKRGGGKIVGPHAWELLYVLVSCEFWVFFQQNALWGVKSLEVEVTRSVSQKSVATLVPEALCEAKKRETTSVANPTSTLDYVQNLNLACDWPFLKICQPVWEINITVS